MNIKARRRLSDLYKRGVEVRFGPGPDGPKGVIAPMSKSAPVGYFLTEEGKPLPIGPHEIQLWVQAPSPLQREMAMRDAQAARARSLVRAKRDQNSEEYLTIMAFLVDMSFETLVDYVLQGEADNIRNDAIREVLAEDEWEDMTTLQDALRQFEEMPEQELKDNAEYEAFMERDAKFGEQVAARESEIADSTRSSLEILSREQLERKALDKRSELVGSQAFMHEYEMQMQFYAVRDFDTPESLFFESARELIESDDSMRDVLQEAMLPFITDAAEAKNSSGAASGSESSELPSEPETSAPSTPEAANA